MLPSLRVLPIVICWVLTTSTSVPVCCASSADSLEFGISMESDHFIIAKPVYVKCVLTNVSDRTLLVNDFSEISENVELRLVRSGFGEVSRSFEVHELKFANSDVKSLVPLDSLVRWIDLTGVFGVPLNRDSHILHLPEGSYFVEIEYEAEHRSTVVEFSVDQPTGRSAAILEELRIIGNLLKVGSSSLALPIIDEALLTNNDDGYGVLLLQLRGSAFRFIDNTNPKEELESLQLILDRYPDSPACEFVLPKIVNSLASSSRLSFLERLVKERAGRNLAYFAKKMIEDKWYLRNAAKSAH